MKTKQKLTVNSVEGLDETVCEIIRLRAERAAAIANLGTRVADIQEAFAEPIGVIEAGIEAREIAVQVYCRSNRAALFAEKKSRETLTAVVGFEWTPHRVETTSKKITWKVVVGSLLGLAWGRKYVRHPEPQVNKDALLEDRETLKDEQLAAVGVRFAQDEQFFIRGKVDVG